MPLYDYRCLVCGEVFEVRHSMNYEDPIPCSVCGSEGTQKVISAPTSVLDWRDSDDVHNSQRFRGAVHNKLLQGAGG